VRIINGEPIRHLLHKILIAQVTHPLVTLGCAAALAALSVAFTVGYLGFQSSQAALVGESDRSIRLLQQADRFSNLDAFVIAVENTNTANTLKFVRKLVPKLKADREHYEQIFARVDPATLKSWALLYLPEKDLSELVETVRANEGFLKNIVESPGLVTFFRQINTEMTGTMVGELFTGFLDEKRPGGAGEEMNLAFLVQFLRQMKASVEGSRSYSSPWQSFFLKDGWRDESEEGYLWTEDRRYLLISVKPTANGQGASKSGSPLKALRQAIAELRPDFPGINVGVTGQKALDEDEKGTAQADMSLATGLSLAGLGVLLVIFWRGIRRPLVEMAVLVVALSLTFGLTTLFIGHLNLLSVTFAPMLLGLGIDYGVHWFARYTEERRHPGTSTRKALEVAMDCVGPAILLAGICASLSFLPLALTGFRGLVELGIICAMGLFVATAATLCLLPALITLSEQHKAPDKSVAPFRDVRPLIRNTRRVSFVIVGLAILASVASVWGALRVRFDLNMLHLQSKDAESVIWENRLIKASKYPSIYGAVFAHSEKEVEEKTRALEALPSVSGVQSIFKVLPSDQQRKIAVLKELRPLLTGVTAIPMPSGGVDLQALQNVLSRIRFKMATSLEDRSIPRNLQRQMGRVRSLIDGLERDFRSRNQAAVLTRLDRFQRLTITDLNDKLSLLVTNMMARPMRVSDLPAPLRDRFVGPGNQYLLRVFPKENVWEPHYLAPFVRDIQSVDPDATGDPVTLSIFTKAFRDAVIKAAVFAVVFILLLLVLTLRSTVSILAALFPLLVGTLWTFGLMYLFKVDLNLANSIFLPLVVGAGVEYGVIVVQRWRQQRPHGGPWSLPVSTGAGVILAGLTTTLGFGSLTMSGHRGVHSLGLLSTIGSLTVLAASVIVLPALLYLVTTVRSREGKQKEPGGAPTTTHKKRGEDEADNTAHYMDGSNTGCGG
jgi:hopanoid biosynthesis associated RND transporter like protein HpnN